MVAGAARSSGSDWACYDHRSRRDNRTRRARTASRGNDRAVRLANLLYLPQLGVAFSIPFQSATATECPLTARPS